jgi:hypothetical protein
MQGRGVTGAIRRAVSAVRRVNDAWPKNFLTSRRFAVYCSKQGGQNGTLVMVNSCLAVQLE